MTIKPVGLENNRSGGLPESVGAARSRPRCLCKAGVAFRQGNCYRGFDVGLSSGAVTIPIAEATLASAQPDITLLLDRNAVITDVKLSNAIAGERFHDWLGRSWIDTVADVGSEKVRRMVSDASAVGVSAFRQVTQRFPSGLELPIEYTTVRIGSEGNLIAVGKSLQAVSELQSRLIAAQHAMEQDYWKLREVETRYRLLFDASNEAVLLLQSEDLHVLEANPAAIRALGVARGWDFLNEIEARDRGAFQAMLARARETGRTPGIVVHLGLDREPWIVRASLMNAESAVVFMLQLASVGARPAAAERTEPLALRTLVERLPDGFVVTDREGAVRRTNRSFLDLVQAGAGGGVIGENLRRWIASPGADLPVLLELMRKHGEVRLFSTRLRGEHGRELDVEISAAGDSATGANYIGILMRDLSGRPAPTGFERLHQAVSAFRPFDLSIPLKTVIQEVVGLVEQGYVEAALERTNGNRAAASELLGMSRQSLYAKLNRYGIDSGIKRLS